MSAPAPGSDRFEDDDLESLGDEHLSGEVASDPEEARSAAEASEAPSPESDTPEDQCENCGALLRGPYCSQCGQKAADRVVPIWHMINEALEAVIELDMRVLHTFPKFLFLPGRLTKEYVNGRRKRYIRPFRLYLFTTFLLFTVLAVTAGQGLQFPFDPQISPAQADTTRLVAGGATDTMAAASAPSFLGSPEQREEWARAIQNNPGAVDVEIGGPETQARLERVLRVKSAEALRNPQDFIRGMIDRGPYVMFLMLPIFAFLLKLLYIRRGRLYVEHLIFSLHVHAFAFFAFTVGLLLGETNSGWLRTAADWIELSPLLYLVFAMSHVYEQGFIKSTIKVLFLLFVYTIILTIGLLFLALAAVVLM
ncbi:MAG: hypothetical protein BRD30_10665 [Bacteroidetes bacterium QH_2_63_10]|nr:MAG: hypothetical protein BRD30_10665 [Bacteroidetes bacterium QH_2_63_10]